ncbi:MAG: hypothetical protein ACTHWZ_04840 [Peptoniphilaceae bacterium]
MLKKTLMKIATKVAKKKIKNIGKKKTTIINPVRAGKILYYSSRIKARNKFKK